MRLVGTLFVISLAFLASFTACLYLCFCLASVLLCHRWTACFEVSDGAAGFGYIVLAPFAAAVAVVVGVLVALVAIALIDREHQRRNSN